ncbi:MAG: hypothetical protein R3213_10385 [Flavobacteriaceae bacterium]|nr:hypothetical protein [Flavobacteriaceae bacterium]
MLKDKIENPINSNQKIFLSVDHLKKGEYTLNILLGDKVLKSVEFKKH